MMRNVVVTVLSGSDVIYSGVPAAIVDVRRGRSRGFRGLFAVPAGGPNLSGRLVLRTADGLTAAVEVAGTRVGADGGRQVAVRGGGWQAPAGWEPAGTEPIRA